MTDPPLTERTLAESTPPSAHAETGTFIQAAAPPTVEVSRGGELPPEYEKLGELGRGGMGVVYRARHRRLNRVVALKMILSGGHAGENEIQRFRTEAEAIAQLQHAHIVQVFDVGEFQGRPYFSLEFCPGGSLEKKLDETPMPPREAAELVEKLAGAMHAAHEKEIVHRDLKPANVLLTAENEPKVTDFGLARRLDPQADSASTPTGSRLTVSGSIMGTPSYMAPEQAAGKSDIGPPADIYALGGVLYDCLCARPPFKAAAVMDTLRQVMNDEPIPPRKFNPKIPADLETICLKCLEKEPTRRYPTARELAADLERFRLGQPIVARPVSRIERGVKWVKRNRALSGLIFAVGLILMGIAVGFPLLYLWQKDLTSRAEENANAARQAHADTQSALLKLAEREAVIQRDLSLRGIKLAQTDALEGNLIRAQMLLDAVPAGERKWEWNYVSRLLRTPLGGWSEGHTRISGLAFSPDGKSVASMNLDGSIRLRDSQTGAVTRTLQAFSKPISIGENELVLPGIAFLPDGNHLVAPAEGDRVVLWDVRDGKRVHEFPGQKLQVAVAISPDGKWLASGGQDSLVQVWDLAKRQKQAELRLSVPARSLAFSPDSQTLAVSSGEVKLWQFLNPSGFARRLRLNANDFGIAYSPDGRWLACASGFDGMIRVFRPADGKLIATLPEAHQSFVLNVLFSPDGRYLASTGWLGTTKLWEVDTWRRVASFHTERSTVGGLAFHPEGHELATGDWHGQAFIWNAHGEAEHATIRDTAASSAHALSYDSTLDRLAFHSGEPNATPGATRFWIPGRGFSAVEAAMPDRKPALASAFSSAGESLFQVYPNAVVGWELQPFKKRWQTLEAVEGLRHLLVHPAEGTLVVAGKDGIIRRLDPANGQLIDEWSSGAGEVRDLALSSDGRKLFSAGGDGTVTEFDWASKASRIRLRGLNEVRHLVVRPGTDQLVTQTIDAELICWSLAGERLWRRGDLAQSSAELGFTPDGSRLAVSRESRVLILDATTGQDLLSLTGHTSRVTDLTFNRPGTVLFTAGLDSTIRRWDATPPGDERGRLRGAAQSLHQQEAFRAKALDQRFAMVYHLSRMIPATEGRTRHTLLMSRGLLLAYEGRYEAALNDFEAAAKLNVGVAPMNVTSTMVLLNMALKRTDQYRPALDTMMLTSFALPKQDRLMLVAVGTLAPDAMSDMKAPLRVVESLLKTEPRDYSMLCFYTGSLYRAGQYEKAKEVANEAMAKHPAGGTIFNWFGLSMIESKLGNREAARRWYDRGIDWMKTYDAQGLEMPGSSEAPTELIWLASLLMRDEAAGLLK